MCCYMLHVIYISASKLKLYMQLRNLVWATSKHDVYLMSHFSVLHWSALTGQPKELVNVQGHVAPREVCF